ncbi:MAG: enoyl-CoA hydratase/isomerase family protein [Syntrophomonadaceae bacterium]
MSIGNLVIKEKANGIAWITMNRPEALNALTPDMMNGVKDAVIEFDQDPEVGVIVITGTGRAWCTGLDLKSLGKVQFQNGRVGPEIDALGRSFIDAIQSASKVVIAMVNGWVFTGGLELLLSMDIIAASDDAEFGDTHCKFGIRPSWGMSQRLPRIIGINRAKYHTFTARNITARQALEYGLVSAVVPRDKLKEEVESICQAILKNSRETLTACKYMYNNGWQTTLGEGLEEVEYNTTFDINDTNTRLAGFIK